MTVAGRLAGPIDAVAFDLDGCLVDSTIAITRSFNHALTQLGFAAQPVVTLRRFIGPPLSAGFDTLLTELGVCGNVHDEMVARAVALYRARYRDASLSETTVVEGVETMLERVAGLHPCVIVTSKPRALAIPIVERLGLGVWFAQVYGPELSAIHETKTMTLERALSGVFAHLGPDRIAMVGDRHHDIDAGRALRTATIGVTWGAGEREELHAAGADVIVETPAALQDMIVNA